MTFSLPLADLSGEVIGALIALGVALFTWLRERASKGDTAPVAPKAAPTPRDEPIRGEAMREDAEAERMRKFMEALGLPADATTTRRETPPPLRPAARPPEAPRRSPIPPIPPIVAQDRPRRPRRAEPPPVPRRERSLDEAGPPVLPVEQIHLPELQTPKVPEYRTVTSTVSALPSQHATEGEAAAFRQRAPGEESALPREVRALLRSPGALRSAVLLREILGAPRGLQPGGFTHTFPSP